VSVLVVSFPVRAFRASHIGEFEDPDVVRPSELALAGMVGALMCFGLAGWILLFGGQGLF
jgi:hypothetical protein